MNKSIILSFTVLFFILCVQHTQGQEKYEKESRINAKLVPQRAIEFIDSLGIDRKIKWYSEIGLKNKSIEAKFKLNGKRYSVEFETNGIIQDVEIEIKLQELSSRLRQSINSQLSQICSSHKISKIQIQHSGNRSLLLSFLNKKTTKDSITTRYELVSKCKKNKKVELFEYLFSNEAKLLKTSKIIFKSSSNLEY